MLKITQTEQKIVKRLKESSPKWDNTNLYSTYFHFIADLLGEVTKISLLFQREDINVPSAVTKLEAAHLSLNAMLNNNGAYLDAFDNDVDDERFREHSLLNLVPRDTLERQKRSIVQDVLDYISAATCLTIRIGQTVMMPKVCI